MTQKIETVTGYECDKILSVSVDIVYFLKIQFYFHKMIKVTKNS